MVYNTYYVPVMLKISAETPEQAEDYAFNDISDISDEVLSLYSIGDAEQEATA